MRFIMSATTTNHKTSQMQSHSLRLAPNQEEKELAEHATNRTE